MHTYDPKKDKFEELSEYIFKLEKQIFEKSTIKPEKINDEVVKKSLFKISSYFLRVSK